MCVGEQAPGNCRSQGAVSQGCADHGTTWQGQSSKFLSDKQKKVYDLLSSSIPAGSSHAKGGAGWPLALSSYPY